MFYLVSFYLKDLKQCSNVQNNSLEAWFPSKSTLARVTTSRREKLLTKLN